MELLGPLLTFGPLFLLLNFVLVWQYYAAQRLEKWMKRPELTDSAFEEIKKVLNSNDFHTLDCLKVLDNIADLGFRFSFKQAEELWHDRRRWDWYFDQLDKRIKYKYMCDLNKNNKINSIKDKILNVE